MPAIIGSQLIEMGRFLILRLLSLGRGLDFAAPGARKAEASLRMPHAPLCRFRIKGPGESESTFARTRIHLKFPEFSTLTRQSADARAPATLKAAAATSPGMASHRRM